MGYLRQRDAYLVGFPTTADCRRRQLVQRVRGGFDLHETNQVAAAFVRICRGISASTVYRLSTTHRSQHIEVRKGEASCYSYSHGAVLHIDWGCPLGFLCDRGYGRGSDDKNRSWRTRGWLIPSILQQRFAKVRCSVHEEGSFIFASWGSDRLWNGSI